MATITKYHRIISIDNVSKRANDLKYMLTAAVRSFDYLRETGISTPLHKFLKHDSNFSRTEKERKKINAEYITHRMEFVRTLDYVRYGRQVPGGLLYPQHRFNDQNNPDNLTDEQKLQIYKNGKRDGQVNSTVYDILIGRAIHISNLHILQDEAVDIDCTD